MNSKTPLVLDFHSVYVNTKYTRTFDVLNSDSIDQAFIVEKCHAKPKLDSGFTITPAESPLIKTGESFRFTVEFFAKAVNSKCSELFTIKHKYGIKDVLFTKASVKGPSCILSCNELQIICPAEKRSVVKKFNITNVGECIVNFQFTIATSHPRIALQPSHGSIPSNKSIHVTITYSPVDHKQYFKRIYCLIEYHEPIILDVHGLWLRSDQNTKLSIIRNIPKYINNVHCFMNREMLSDATNKLPLLSVDRWNIDFGHCLPKYQKQDKFTVTNNSDAELLLVWNQDVLGKNFKVLPSQVNIGIHRSVNFNVIFKPTAKELLYSSILEAQLFLSEHLQLFHVDINLKGHSFEEVSCGWSAQYKVKPSRLVLPPCMPQPVLNSYTTLTIRRYGHLPLAFKFHPPTHSNFRVKPLQGLIQGQFQIVIVDFCPTTSSEALYIEKWMLSFNSNEDINQCIVELAGSVETPKVIVNNEEDVVFPKVHPGSLCEILVNVFNPTRLSFWYNLEILKGDSVLKLEKKGELWPQEHKKVSWWFQPQRIGELEALISCTPSVEDDVQVNTALVIVRAICEETELQVVPRGLRFDQVLRGCQHTRGFELINSGDSYINGTFKWWPEGNCSTTDIEVNFESTNFKLEPGTKVLVNVLITPLKTGSMNVSIGYYTNEATSSVLLQAAVESVFPSLKVVDLRHNNTGPLFTKLNFWNMMQINKLNSILHDLKKGDIPSVHMTVPSYLCTSQDVTIELLLENASPIGVQFSILQKATCDCKPTRTAVSFSRSTWKDNCTHKNQLQISPMFGNIEAQRCTILSLNVSYKTVGIVDLIFSFTFTPEDYEEIQNCIEIHFSRTSIPEDTVFIDTVEPMKNGHFVFDMKPVFIGDCYPFVQAFTLYNNSEMSATIDLDIQKLHGSPFKFVGKTKTMCPFTTHPLLFTFLPYTTETYEEEISLTINNEPKGLILRGTGLSSGTNNLFLEKNEPISRDGKLTVLKPAPVYLSTSYIYIGRLKPSCCQRNVIFVTNTTEDIISFKWNIVKLSEVVELRVYPQKGAVGPKGVAECRLVSQCKGFPCHLTSTLTCMFASFSKYSRVIQSIHKYKEKVKRNKECFVITESGEKHFVVSPPSEDWPRESYVTVSVTLDVKCEECNRIDEYLPFTPASYNLDQSRELFSNMSDEQRLEYTSVLEGLLCETFNDLSTNLRVKSCEPSLRYIQITNVTKQLDIAVPGQIIQTVIEDLLYTVWLSMFNLAPRNSISNLRQTITNHLQLTAENRFDDLRTSKFMEHSSPTSSSIFLTQKFQHKTIQQ